MATARPFNCEENLLVFAVEAIEHQKNDSNHDTKTRGCWEYYEECLRDLCCLLNFDGAVRWDATIYSVIED